MSYSFKKNPISGQQELVINGWEKGIASSPHNGLASMQSVNISTELGEVMCAFNRVKQSQTGTTGTLTRLNTNTVTPGGITLLPGQVITVTVDGGTGLIPTPTVDALIVAGGGGGGVSQGGGGAAGGMKTLSSSSLSVAAFPVVVGGGGAGGVAGRGATGSDSSFNGTTSHGGGGGGSHATTQTGINGGSGGGGSGSNTGGSTAGGTGTGGEGSNGGTGSLVADYGGGGGGGAGAVGGNGSAGVAGNGGVGVSSSISGSATFYAGGGGGAPDTGAGTAGNGGNGGGGAGSKTTTGTAGAANTGGGGGATITGQVGGGGGSGVVVVSYTTGIFTATGGTITTNGTKTVHTFNSSGTFTVTAVSNQYYYLGNGKLYRGALPPNDPDTATVVTGITAGTATYVITYPLGSPIQKATEVYSDTSNATQYRYYILDSLGSVWCHDTRQLSAYPTPDWKFIGAQGPGASGLAVYNGWVAVAYGYSTYWKLTSLFGVDWGNADLAIVNNSSISSHSMLVTHSNTLLGTDGNHITYMYADTSLQSGFANIQSYMQYTAVTTVGTATALIGGSVPSDGTFGHRIPAFFYASTTRPTAISADTIYWVQWAQTSFGVYAAASGGSAIDIQTGSSGNQYFNTLSPYTTQGTATFVYSPQQLNLPFYEKAQCMAELGNLVIIGGQGNVLYPWDQSVTTITANGIIPLPESNTVRLITVNSVCYAFSGSKGNVYITNGSSASIALSVPDYMAGIAGTPTSYIEPYFSWGDADYMRGRVWFSILDQTATKAGNCGGIWSFVPSQNFSQDQQTMSLRMDNQSSYGTYSGLASVILPSQNQSGISPQYWAGWYSSISAPTYGIDFTDTVPTPSGLVETDLIEVGTHLNKMTFTQIMYRLAAPLASGETVTMSYRTDASSAYVACNAFEVESATGISGVAKVNFQKTQWLQLRISLNPVATGASSFVRLQEVTLILS